MKTVIKIFIFIFGLLDYILVCRIKKKTYSLHIIAAGLSVAGFNKNCCGYLKVHWLSDVLGGIALTAATFCYSIGFFEKLNQYALFVGPTEVKAQ